MNAEKELIYLAVNPPRPVAPSVIDGAAALTGKNPFELRLLLAAKIPRIITQYDDKLIAEKVAGQLQAMGLSVITCRETTLHQPAPIFTVQQLTFIHQGVIFRDHHDNEARMESTHLFLGIIGNADTDTEKSRTTTRLKLNTIATLLTGGLPVWGKVEEKTTSHTVSHESFIRLYQSDITAPVIEMRQREMNYAFLGEQISPSSLINFRLAVERLRAALPGVIFDDRLADPAALPDGQLAQDIDTSCRLIYYFELIAHGHPFEA